NCKDIKEASYNRMVLTAFNFPQFGYETNDAFTDVNIGTITYQYTEVGTARYIERTAEFPTPALKRTQQKLLTNLILAPDTTSYLFRGGPLSTPPYESVDISIHMNPSIMKTSVLSYSETAMKRTYTQ